MRVDIVCVIVKISVRVPEDVTEVVEEYVFMGEKLFFEVNEKEADPVGVRVANAVRLTVLVTAPVLEIMGDALIELLAVDVLDVEAHFDTVPEDDCVLEGLEENVLEDVFNNELVKRADKV